MDIQTGKIHDFLVDDDVTPDMRELLIPVNPDQMNRKQRREMRVSKHDNRSPLGKQFTAARKARRQREKQSRRRNRK